MMRLVGNQTAVTVLIFIIRINQMIHRSKGKFSIYIRILLSSKNKVFQFGIVTFVKIQDVIYLMSFLSLNLDFLDHQ